MNEEDTPSYAVRVSNRAERDIAEAVVYLAGAAGDGSLAKQWLDGLYAEFGRLATHPSRCIVSERESKIFGVQMRKMTYRRTTGSVAYFVLFTVVDEGEDGPLVRIVTVRHSGRKPITRAEARQILAGQ